MDFWVSVAIVFVLLMLSGFFSGSETALTAASKSRLHEWEKRGNKRAGMVNKIRSNKDRMIGSLLLGNNLVNILASALTTSVLIKLVGEAGVVYATLIMTALVLIFAEVLPKTYALTHADKMSVAIAPIIRFVIWLFYPVAEAVNFIVRLTFKLFGADMSKISDGSHMDILRGVIELHEGQDTETHEQRAMLRSVLDLFDVDIEEIMTHRKNVLMLDALDPVEEIIQQTLESPYTRMPVFRDDPDNIVGVLHAKDLMRELKAREQNNQSISDIDIMDLVADPWFVPEATTLFDQLQAFKSRRGHFAVVVDEYGSFMGIVTLEDILEEIVGEIDDEHDETVIGVRKQAGGSFMVDGDVTIRDLNREFEWELPDDADYSTLAGLIIHEARAIPEAGQSFTFHKFRFDIVKRQRNQLALIRVMPPLKEENEAAA
ncbi:MAG: HlyC/CorC family transporter [Alphaproteobacteria bacterium]|nr:HlyC/CorC family transporter [Alphaproteobacteria bacterium]